MTIIARPDHLDDAASMWDDVLTSFAASLDEQRTFLLTAHPDQLMDERALRPPTFAPPATMPPMPDEFVSWARSLLDQTEGLVRLAADVLEHMPAPAHRPHRHAPMTGAVTSARPQWDRTM